MEGGGGEGRRLKGVGGRRLLVKYVCRQTRTRAPLTLLGPALFCYTNNAKEMHIERIEKEKERGARDPCGSARVSRSLSPFPSPVHSDERGSRRDAPKERKREEGLSSSGGSLSIAWVCAGVCLRVRLFSSIGNTFKKSKARKKKKEKCLPEELAGEREGESARRAESVEVHTSAVLSPPPPLTRPRE